MPAPTPHPSAHIIAIEAASRRCSVALCHGGAIHTLSSDAGQRAAESIPELLQQLLAQSALRLHGIDAFAFGAGPGGFTGLRVACAFTQGLAFGCGRPVIAVNSLRALAHAAQAGAGERVLAAVDARMGQIYWGIYEITDAGPRELSRAAVADPGDMDALARNWRPDAIVGDALQAYPQAWPAGLAKRCDASLAVDASAIAALAWTDWPGSKGVPARDAAPEYVRDRVALTVEERRAGAGAAQGTLA